MLIVKTLFILVSLLMISSCSSLEKTRGLSSIIDNSEVWREEELSKNRTLNILFLNGNKTEKNLVEEIASIWTEYANLNFRFHDKKLGDNREVFHIRIEFVKNGKNLSIVGRGAIRTLDTTMWLNLDKKLSPLNHRDTILHEFGHALGALHEHSHPLRNFDFSDKAESICLGKFPSSKGDPCLERVYPLHNINERPSLIYSEYDEKSIMHYQLQEKSMRDGIERGGAQFLSIYDKLMIAKIYPGRATQEEIRKRHYRELEESLLINDYSKCVIKETTQNNKRYYYYRSLEEVKNGGSFSVAIYPGKREVLYMIKNDSKCL